MSNTASEKIKELHRLENEIYIIHYSCQTLGDGNEGLSPRITSIAVLHLASSSMHSFSIHLIAEVMGIKRDSIEDHYDKLEMEMLEEFYRFVKTIPSAIWLHWNMDNINYGFELLAHRYKVLTQKDAPTIPDSKRQNLSSLILGIYGSKCVNDPKMENLMILNSGKHRDFINGKEEAAAFAAKEYVKLHKSTMCKVYWFKSMYHKLISHKIKTSKSNWKNKISDFTDKPWVKLLGFIAVMITIFQLFYFIFTLYKPKPDKLTPTEVLAH